MEVDTEILTTIPVVSIVGKSDSGKTTLLEKLIRESKSRGWRVATVKHDVHGFEMDTPGKDTWRHAKAGADIVSISSPSKVAIIENVPCEQELNAIISRFSSVDIIFTEGYRLEGKYKIEVFRSVVHETPLCDPKELAAIVSDKKINYGVPCFDLDDSSGICDFIDKKFKINK